MAVPDPAFDRQPLQWTFLEPTTNGLPFDQYSVADQTNDLTKTGIIRFAFPSTATSSNTMMGEQLFSDQGRRRHPYTSYLQPGRHSCTGCYSCTL